MDPITPGLAADPRSVGDLKRRAIEDPDAALPAVARQFEQLLLDMMLKSMRTAAPGESLFDNEGSRLFTSLLDQEFSRKLAEQGGLGLADLLVKQLSQLRAPGREQPGQEKPDPADKT
jgi:flagellar protein FlgJ